VISIGLREAVLRANKNTELRRSLIFERWSVKLFTYILVWMLLLKVRHSVQTRVKGSAVCLSAIDMASPSIIP
jgi:hypothetical protein